MGKLFRVSGFFIKLSTAYILAFFIKFFRPSMRNVWIISERSDDARDNGYFFYRYMKEKHPEMVVYYVIKKTSVDAEKIRRQDLIDYNSFRHFVFFALCKVRISSHANGGDVPNIDYYKKLGFYKHTKKKVIFLQHGIIKDFLPSLCYPNIRPDLFVCGAEPEWRYIHDNFNHPEGVVQYTGLARYDSLNEFKTKNQILVMPTFRKYLQGLDSEDFLQ
ncbi:CDP-glycerol glycerophosphotransferase family protein, partial [bacterium]|nr:CDP-glycerol glycerophosphotransferase family protein [bacterium]